YLLHTDTFTISLAELDPVITVDGVVLGTTINYASYQWLRNGAIIGGADQPEYTVTENGDYQVIVTNEGGCVDTSDVYVVDNVSINRLANLSAQIRIYPNPARDIVYILSPVGLMVQISDLSGRVLQHISSSDTEHFVSLAQ